VAVDADSREGPGKECVVRLIERYAKTLFRADRYASIGNRPAYSATEAVARLPLWIFNPVTAPARRPQQQADHWIDQSSPVDLAAPQLAFQDYFPPAIQLASRQYTQPYDTPSSLSDPMNHPPWSTSFDPFQQYADGSQPLPSVDFGWTPWTPGTEGCLTPATSFQLQQPPGPGYSYGVASEAVAVQSLPWPAPQGSEVPAVQPAVTDFPGCGSFHLDETFKQCVTNSVMESAHPAVAQNPAQCPGMTETGTSTASAPPAPHRSRPLPVPQGPRVRLKRNATLPPTPPLHSPRPRAFVETGGYLAGGGGCGVSEPSTREDGRAVSPVVEMLEGMVS
jgi:hypothetical protein